MDYSKMSLQELKAELKERGEKGYSSLHKEELVELLKKLDEANKPPMMRLVKKGETPAEDFAETAEAQDTIQPSANVAEVAERAAAYSADRGFKPDNRMVRPSECRQMNGERPYQQRSDNGERTSQQRSDNGERTYQQRPDDRNRMPRQNQSNQNQQNQQGPTSMGQPASQGQLNPRQSDTPDIPVNERKTEYTEEEIKQLDSGITKEGIFEIPPESSYGFIRCDNFMPGEGDVYVSPAMIRKYGLRTGDFIIGNTKIGNEKFPPLLYIKTVNGLKPEKIIGRPKFENLTPIFPNERLRLEVKGQASLAMRMMDLISPIGKGQRGMIVSQPKAGKTTLIKDIANSVTKNNPEMHLIILLIDERPEEVTDIKESIVSDNVEVIYSTFDQEPSHHKRVSEMVIDRARRLVEQKQDVMILLDSITRLARAYNLTVQPSGRTLSGGLDPAALYMPKKFFGAARNMREGGSLTILATALVETGSRMDDVVFEEFKGTGNMELVLDRSMAEKRIFPAIDLAKSSTRKDDLLFTEEEVRVNTLIKRALLSPRAEDALISLVGIFKNFSTNKEVIRYLEKEPILSDRDNGKRRQD